MRQIERERRDRSNGKPPEDVLQKKGYAWAARGDLGGHTLAEERLPGRKLTRDPVPEDRLNFKPTNGID